MTATTLDRSRPPAPGPPRPFELTEIVRHDPADGLSLYLAPRPGLPLVSIEVMVRRGADREADGPRGLASLAAGMLDEGSGDWTALDVARAAEALGGHLSTSGDWDGTFAAIGVASDQARRALELLGRVLAEPTFPRHEVERLIAHRRADLQRRSTRPDFLAARALLRTIYGDHVYGETLLGDTAGLDRIDRDRIREWHRTVLRPARTHVLVAGDFDATEVAKLVTATMPVAEGTARSGAPQPLPAPSVSRRVVIVDRPDAPQTELRVGHAGPGRAHPDRPALTVMTTLFGGKFTSRINLRLREELGITYGASCRLGARRGPGPIVVGPAVDTDATGTAVREILAGMERLQSETAAHDEVEDARSYLLGAFPYTIQTVDGLLGRVEQAVLHDLGLDYYRRLPERIGNVTPEDVSRVARGHLLPEQATVVAVGPAAALEAQLSDLGEVDVQAVGSP